MCILGGEKGPERAEEALDVERPQRERMNAGERAIGGGGLPCMEGNPSSQALGTPAKPANPAEINPR